MLFGDETAAKPSCLGASLTSRIVQEVWHCCVHSVLVHTLCPQVQGPPAVGGLFLNYKRRIDDRIET